MSDRSFLDQVTTLITRLPSDGLPRLIEKREDETFGNAHALFESQGVRIRVVRDRGEVRIELADGRGGAWRSLDELCELVDEAAPKLDLESNVQSLVNAWPEIVRAFDDANLDRTNKAIDALAKKRRDATIARIWRRTK